MTSSLVCTPIVVFSADQSPTLLLKQFLVSKRQKRKMLPDYLSSHSTSLQLPPNRIKATKWPQLEKLYEIQYYL